ncbi:MAG TPA: SRPBCC family protein [Candidatus Saccharimonadales bacterium]|nr:SRPBCC family protein [Candidatus Saccharimonadales bacterium]
MSERTITRGSFTLERMFDAPVEKVWAAFADMDAKQKWFHGPDGPEDEHTMDFQVGGHEHSEGMIHGVMSRFEATYYDIVPNERIVYAYEMYLDDQRISVSLTTMEFSSEGGKTKLVLHEDGAFLDDFDRPEGREQGTRELLEALASSL